MFQQSSRISILFIVTIFLGCGSNDSNVPATPRFPDRLGAQWEYSDYSDTSGTGRQFELIGTIRRTVVEVREVEGKVAVFTESRFTPVPGSTATETIDTTLFSVTGNNRFIYLNALTDLIGDALPLSFETTFKPGWYPYLMYGEDGEYTIINRDTLFIPLDEDTLFIQVRAVGRVLPETQLELNGRMYQATPLNLSISLTLRLQDTQLPLAPLILTHWCADDIGLVRQITGSISLPPEVLGTEIRSPAFRYDLNSFSMP